VCGAQTTRCQWSPQSGTERFVCGIQVLGGGQVTADTGDVWAVWSAAEGDRSRSQAPTTQHRLAARIHCYVPHPALDRGRPMSQTTPLALRTRLGRTESRRFHDAHSRECRQRSRTTGRQTGTPPKIRTLQSEPDRVRTHRIHRVNRTATVPQDRVRNSTGPPEG
jgi:hypothetical protein